MPVASDCRNRVLTCWIDSQSLEISDAAVKSVFACTPQTYSVRQSCIITHRIDPSLSANSKVGLLCFHVAHTKTGLKPQPQSLHSPHLVHGYDYIYDATENHLLSCGRTRVGPEAPHHLGKDGASQHDACFWPGAKLKQKRVGDLSCTCSSWMQQGRSTEDSTETRQEPSGRRDRVRAKHVVAEVFLTAAMAIS